MDNSTAVETTVEVGTIERLECDVSRSSTQLIKASNDQDAVKAWLSEYFNRSPHTRRSYRKESTRLLMWCENFRLQFKDISKEDLVAFATFIADPHPAERWIEKRKLPLSHEDWKPFSGPLSEASQSQTLQILTNLFTYLSDNGYLDRNVFKASKRLSPKPKKQSLVTRYLSQEDIALLGRCISDLPESTETQARKKARAQFVFDLYCTTGIRLAEGVSATLGDVQRNQENDWEIVVRRKGHRVDDKSHIPLAKPVVQSFYRYLTAYNLDHVADSTMPLILTSGRPFHGMTSDAVYKMINRIFAQGVSALNESRDIMAIKRLKKASTHWLRHSCFSHLLTNGASIKEVQTLADHASIKTTSIYLHGENKKFHNAIVSKVRIPSQ